MGLGKARASRAHWGLTGEQVARRNREEAWAENSPAASRAALKLPLRAAHPPARGSSRQPPLPPSPPASLPPRSESSVHRPARPEDASRTHSRPGRSCERPSPSAPLCVSPIPPHPLLPTPHPSSPSSSAIPSSGRRRWVPLAVSGALHARPWLTRSGGACGRPSEEPRLGDGTKLSSS